MALFTYAQSSQYATSLQSNGRRRLLEAAKTGQGHVQAFLFDHTVETGGVTDTGIIHLGILPAGQYYLLPQSLFQCQSQTGVSISFGLDEHKNTGGEVTVAGDVDSILPAKSIASVLSFPGFNEALGTGINSIGGFLVDSQENVNLIAQVTGGTLTAGKVIGVSLLAHFGF